MRRAAARDECPNAQMIPAKGSFPFARLVSHTIAPANTRYDTPIVKSVIAKVIQPLVDRPPGNIGVGDKSGEKIAAKTARVLRRRKMSPGNRVNLLSSKNFLSLLAWTLWRWH